MPGLKECIDAFTAASKPIVLQQSDPRIAKPFMELLAYISSTGFALEHLAWLKQTGQTRQVEELTLVLQEWFDRPELPGILKSVKKYSSLHNATSATKEKALVYKL